MVETSKYLKLNSHESIYKYFDKYIIYNNSYQFLVIINFLNIFLMLKEILLYVI